jgi:uncharacterized protein
MIPYTIKVDIFEEFRRVCDFPFKLFILKLSLDELEKIIIQQKGKHKLAAKLAIEMLDQNNISIIEATKENNVDNTILKIAEEKGYFVATQDILLKKKLKEKKVPVIFLRQKKYLVVEK